MLAGLDAAVNDAASRGRELLVVNDPAVRETLGVHDQVGRAVQVLDVGELGRPSNGAAVAGTARDEGEGRPRDRDRGKAHRNLRETEGNANVPAPGGPVK